MGYTLYLNFIMSEVILARLSLHSPPGIHHASNSGVIKANRQAACLARL